MNKIIRIVVSGLSLCGALAMLPGIAEAREPNRNVPGHVEHPRAGEHGREGRWERGHDRGERARFEHERACHAARERGEGRRMREIGCLVR